MKQYSSILKEYRGLCFKHNKNTLVLNKLINKQEQTVKNIKEIINRLPKVRTL